MNSKVQQKSLETAKTSFEVTDRKIEVAEPLLAGGKQSSTGLSARLAATGAAGNRLGDDCVPQSRPPGNASADHPVKLYSAFCRSCLLGLFFAAKLVSQITAPLKGLSQTAQAITDGDLDRKADRQGRS